MDRWIASIGALALALAGPVSSLAQEAAEPPQAEARADAPESEAEPEPYWLLEEFDWGDDEEVVLESIEFDPYFVCRGTPQNRCVLVSTEISGEELLARFHHHEGELWQVAILTPDLTPDLAAKHLGRIWRLLVGYAAQKLGEPAVAFELPDREALSFGPPLVTHFWSTPGLETRVAIGRRDVDLFYVALLFSDPVRGAVAREAYDATVAEFDAKAREKRRAKRKLQKERAGEKRQGKESRGGS